MQRQRGLSLHALGRLTHYDVGYLSKVINGHKHGSRDLAMEMDRHLDANGALLTAWERSPRPLVRPVHSPQSRRLPDVAQRVLTTALDADVDEVLSWLESTNITQEALSFLTQSVERAAEEHTAEPPAVMLTKVRQLHGMIWSILKGGRQRQRQTAELLRLDADLLAQMCQLLGDVHLDRAASAYARSSIALAREAGSSSAPALSALAQIARWRGGYAEAADLAARGTESSPPTNLRMLLAYQEANAAALAGQAPRARRVFAKADAMEMVPVPYSAWSCPPARRALFRTGVALNLGESAVAVSHAAEAAPIWERERQRAFATWAHFQIVAAVAHLQTDAPDAAAAYIQPVLDLSAEYRISTVVEHMAEFDKLLRAARSGQSSVISPLRQRIYSFRIDALSK